MHTALGEMKMAGHLSLAKGSSSLLWGSLHCLGVRGCRQLWCASVCRETRHSQTGSEGAVGVLFLLLPCDLVRM